MPHPSQNDQPNRGQIIKLESKRRGANYKAKVGGVDLFITANPDADGNLAEIFIDIQKAGAPLRSLLNCFAIAVNIGLQHGAPLEKYVEFFAHTKFEPCGFVDGHGTINQATSIIDYIFRLLGMEFLNITEFIDGEDPKTELVYEKEQHAKTSNP